MRQITDKAKQTKLLNMSEYIDDQMSKSLLDDCLEIKRMLISSINTAKENIK